MERVRGPVAVRDGGRPGQAAAGVPRGGFADGPSARLANRLVGNRDDAPLLEVALAAPRVRLTGACAIAWTGAAMACRLDGVPLPTWRRVRVPAGGATLEGGGAERGVFGYLAVGGTWEVDRWRGSASPLRVGASMLPASGVVAAGRVIAVATELPVGGAYAHPLAGLAGGEVARPRLDVWEAPESAAWWRALGRTFGGVDGVRAARWRVLPASDRVGVRLAGGGVGGAGSFAGMRSAPCLPGTVQLAPGGTLLVSGEDGPTMGGYPRIGRLDGGDVARLARRRPGEAVGLAWRGWR